MYWWSIQQLFLLLLFSPLLTRHVFHGHVSSFFLFVCFAFGTTVFAEYMVKKKGKQTWLFVVALLCNVSVLLAFPFVM